MKVIRRLLSIVVIGACCLAVHGQTIEGFVNGLLKQYPEARLLDIYKSCFQDYMGAEHLVSDTATVLNYLQQELATTTADDLLPWYSEPCGIYGNYVRVSLRAVHEGYITADALLDAFIASANGEERPAVEDWAAQWRTIIKVIDQMKLSLPDYEQDKQDIDGVLAQGKYAISHSPQYRQAYAPHYRIVRRDIFTREIAPYLPK
jgi:hypothetical protein